MCVVALVHNSILDGPQVFSPENLGGSPSAAPGPGQKCIEKANVAQKADVRFMLE